MANLADQITQGIKDAMRAKDKVRLATLRDIKSKLLLEATKEGAGDTIEDATTLPLLTAFALPPKTVSSFRDQLAVAVRCLNQTYRPFARSEQTPLMH